MFFSFRILQVGEELRRDIYGELGAVPWLGAPLGAGPLLHAGAAARRPGAAREEAPPHPLGVPRPHHVEPTEEDGQGQ